MKYLLVISHSGGYPLSLIITYSMSSAYHLLVLGNYRSVDFIIYQILLFRLHLRKYINDLVLYPQNRTFGKFKADFSCNFTNF